MCTAWIKPDGFVEVWTSTQNGEASLAEAAATAGVPLEKVRGPQDDAGRRLRPPRRAAGLRDARA